MLANINSWVLGLRRVASAWYRRTIYSTFNAAFRTDLGAAVVLFVVAFALARFLPAGGAKSALIAVPLAGIAMAMLWSFVAVQSFLGREVAYENLQSAERPRLKRFLDVFLKFPCTAVVTFAIVVGALLAASGLADWPASLQSNLLEVVLPIPFVGASLSRAISAGAGVEKPRLPWRLDYAVSLVYSSLVFSLVLAWWRRGAQRRAFAARLLTSKGRRADTAYGTRRSRRNSKTKVEADETVLLMRGERIGLACLPYLRVELAAPAWAPPEVEPDRCRGAVAVLEQIFSGPDKPTKSGGRGSPDQPTSWRGSAGAADWITTWLVAHFEHLMQLDATKSGSGDHRLGEAATAAAAALAKFVELPHRPTPQATGLFRDLPREKLFRRQLEKLFERSPSRPTLLVAACAAAEQLGRPEDLKLLDKQTRRLDVNAGFTIRQTDSILETRDRVLARLPDRKATYPALEALLESGAIEREPSAPETRFRRPDGAVMVLVPGGSFFRGGAGAATEPGRRVHVGAYLIDVEPVTSSAFQSWVAEAGSVFHTERGFFPVQSVPPAADPHESATHVTWFAAQAYAKAKIAGGRLPTEAEWEKAARGTDGRRYPSGDKWSDDCLSPDGVHAGHVLEWALDAYEKLAYKLNPSVFDPVMESPRSAGDEAARSARGRTPGTPAADYSLADRIALEPVTGCLTSPVCFRVAVPLEPGESS